MAIYTIHLLVPRFIHAGLADGTLTRNAAGIVRATALHPTRQAGTIFGHLREVNGPSQAMPQSGFMPAVATMALQAATLAYLKVRLDRIEAQLEAIHHQGNEILLTIGEVRDLQYLVFTRPAAEALELLHRYDHGRRAHLLDDAHTRFVEAVGGLRQFIAAHSAERMIENAQAMETWRETLVIMGKRRRGEF